MDDYEYSELLKELEGKCSNIEKIIKPQELQRELENIATLEQDPLFWNDVKKAGEIGKQKSRFTKMLQTYQDAYGALQDAKELFEISNEDEAIRTLLFMQSVELEKKIKKVEIEVMLSDEHDASNAIMTIQPGAGGTESQDWGSMLYRMYLRWAERRGFKIELLDYQDGEEAGIKGVAFIIKGENAYGYMKSENGVHRLVRISPFDANAKRHTSFSSVQVSPELSEDIDIVIEEKDIRIDTYRASGAGGGGR